MSEFQLACGAVRLHPTVDSPPPYLGYPVESSGQQGGRSGVVFRVSTDYRTFRALVRYHIAYDIAFVVELVLSRMDPLQIVISGVLVTYNGAAQR